MDVIFDIDGTLADAGHRLHLIKDVARYVSIDGGTPRPNWEVFLSDEQIAKDAPIAQTFQLLTSMLEAPQDYRVIFITGRPWRQSQTTYEWLRGSPQCPVRCLSWNAWEKRSEVQGRRLGPILYMRSDGDRRQSHVVKEDLLNRARRDGFDPKLVFEDRKDDTEMWRRNGLLCCQVAEGDY